MTKQGERLPYYIPEWIRRRIETDIFVLDDFIKESATTLPNGSLVLDAGAGQGQYKDYFSHTRYIGADLAVGDSSWDYSNLDVFCDLIRLPFPTNTFDAVVCTQVLEHLPEPKIFLAEISRVLKPNGRLFLTAPQSWHQHQKPYDFYRYTSFGLKYLFSQNNLEPKSIEPMGGYFWYLSFQFQNINYWLFPKTMRLRKWTWPLRALFGLIFQLLLPLLLYYLDPLDHSKDETFGYLCAAVKSQHKNEIPD